MSHLDQQQLLMGRLGRMGYNKRLALYTQAYSPDLQSVVKVEECIIYEDRYGGKTPLLRCKVTGVPYVHWYRPEELTDFRV